MNEPDLSLTEAVEQAIRSFNRFEKRLFKLAVCNLELDEHINRPEKYPFSRVSAEEYAEAYDLLVGTARIHLKDASLRLIEGVLTYDEDGRGLTRITWTRHVACHDEGDQIDLDWNPVLLPDLLTLQDKYRLERR